MILRSRQGEGYLRSPGSVPAVRKAGPPRLSLQGESTPDEPALGEGWISIRPLQRPGRVLQEERFAVLQQSGRNSFWELHLHPLQRAGHRGAQPSHHSGEYLLFSCE